MAERARCERTSANQPVKRIYEKLNMIERLFLFSR